MYRSTALLLVVALAALAGLVGCGDSDDEGSAPPPAVASKPAPKAPAAADRLDASDASILAGVNKAVAQYCASKDKVTPGEVTAAVATLESLYAIDPAAAGSDGKTVKQIALTVQRKLRACGDGSAARRVAKLTR
jgi:ABC-type phosphate transport system substrate-binding protein